MEIYYLALQSMAVLVMCMLYYIVVLKRKLKSYESDMLSILKENQELNNINKFLNTFKTEKKERGF